MGPRYFYVGTLSIFFAFVFPTLMVCQDTANEKLSRAANCFTLNFYKQLAKSGGSFVSSPFSLDVLLSILRFGSGGKTQQELTNSLEYKDLSVSSMVSAFKSKLEKLTSSNGNTLEVANSVWIQEGFSVKQSFKDVVAGDFNSKVENVNFADSPGATKQINSWGNDKTHGLIPKLFAENLDPSTVMVLVNAIYFKGEWSTKFDTDETQTGSFYNLDSKNNPSTVKLMHKQDAFKYNLDSTLGVQVLEMDYKGGDMSMVIFLPQEGSTIANLEAALTCEKFESALASLGETAVDVTFPKFEITSNFDLKAPIMNMGVNDIFQNTANFSGIAPGLEVTKAIQKAIIKVNEEGSEAAALTGIVMEESDAVDSGPEMEIFYANHPFLFIIRDKTTNLVLFIGRVSELQNVS